MPGMGRCEDYMIRLDKYLADAGIGTRSEVKKYIKNKKISVNQAVTVKPEQKIDPDKDHICYDGQEICCQRFYYYLFHKPAGCVTARSDRKDRTVMDFFPEEDRRKLSPVGRLDKDTEGLLLITNDGELNHKLTSPAYHLEKTYYAQLDQPVSEQAAELLAKGIDIGDDKPTLPAKLKVLPTVKKQGEEIYAAELTIVEGRYHQVKRMFLALGCEVVYLKRLSIGGLTLGTLARGEYRPLTEQELMSLKEKCNRKGQNNEV